MLTIVLLLFFIMAVTKHTSIQGFGEEELGDIGIFTLFVGVDFVKVTAAMIIMRQHCRNKGGYGFDVSPVNIKKCNAANHGGREQC